MPDELNSPYNPLNPTTPTASESLGHHHQSSECADPNSPHHTLDCGHVVLIPLLPAANPIPSTPVPKSAHAPNCLRLVTALKPSLPLSWLKNTLPAPFVCPQCVEMCVRCDYDSFAFLDRGSARRDREMNIELWTYEAVLSMVEDGGRMCEVAAGVGQDEIEDRREIDAEDASRVAVLKARYHDQAMKQQDEMDELAERLGDTKVGELDGDMDIEDFLKSLDGLRACD
ncbi:hypothetical protein BDU57DRAFT_579237 [Ampelomyces quisqualis]|uniref:Uncharacterized protein n=1 Tax=Ampelomyces quisqualis TaxID=50730 RepID=A0A6A5QGP9_AMPQU|nr:hypothetical protein BDU57DRAFT_579237 [Ampelomyces quisqualis]